jgi:hypothetical protein
MKLTLEECDFLKELLEDNMYNFRYNGKNLLNLDIQDKVTREHYNNNKMELHDKPKFYVSCESHRNIDFSDDEYHSEGD